MSPDKIQAVPAFKWIRVEKGKPDVGVVCWIRMVSPNYGFRSYASAQYEGHGNWRIPGSDYAKHITHWSYIPEPVDDSVLLIIDEPSELPQEVIDALKSWKPKLSKPKPTRTERLERGWSDHERRLVAAVERLDRLEKRPYLAPLQRKPAKGEPIIGKLITPKPPGCRCTSNLLGCHLSMEGIISCIQCGGEVPGT